MMGKHLGGCNIGFQGEISVHVCMSPRTTNLIPFQNVCYPTDLVTLMLQGTHAIIIICTPWTPNRLPWHNAGRTFIIHHNTGKIYMHLQMSFYSQFSAAKVNIFRLFIWVGLWVNRNDINTDGAFVTHDCWYIPAHIITWPPPQPLRLKG